MSSVTREQVESAIKQYIDPYLDQDLVTAKCIKNVAVDDGKVSVDVVLGYPSKGHQADLNAKLAELITALAGVSEVNINICTKIEAHAV